VVSRRISNQESSSVETHAEESASCQQDEPLSPDTEKCLQHAEAIVEELFACAARPPSGESSDSGKGSLLEATSDFSPTKSKSWSTPASPTFQGIVKQRLKSFQVLKEKSDPKVKSPRSGGASPTLTSRTYKSEERCQEIEEINRNIKAFYTSISEDEQFKSSVMETGYVKALVQKINENKLKKQEQERKQKAVDQNADISEELSIPVEFPMGKEDSGWGEWVEESKRETTEQPSDGEDRLEHSGEEEGFSKSGVNENVETKCRKDSERRSSGSDTTAPNESNQRESSSSATSVSSVVSDGRSQVSKALQRFNQERHKAIPHSPLKPVSSSSPSFSYLHGNTHIRPNPKLRQLKSHNGDVRTNTSAKSNNKFGAHAHVNVSPSAVNRNCLSCDVENALESNSEKSVELRGCVSQSFDYGLLPLNPAELFDENWTQCELSFDDFDLDDTAPPKVWLSVFGDWTQMHGCMIFCCCY